MLQEEIWEVRDGWVLLEDQFGIQLLGSTTHCLVHSELIKIVFGSFRPSCP